MIETIKKVLPSGLAWLLPRSGYMQGLIAGIAMEFDRLALFLERVAYEANPATAVDCLEEWYGSYGIRWDPTGSLAGRRAKAISRFISLGGQDIVYLQLMMDEAGLGGVTISETLTTTYPDNLIMLLTGEVSTLADYARMEALIQRLSPAHLTPDYTGVAVDTNVWGEAIHGLNVYAGT